VPHGGPFVVILGTASIYEQQNGVGSRVNQVEHDLFHVGDGLGRGLWRNLRVTAGGDQNERNGEEGLHRVPRAIDVKVMAK
jgi:hypothetical protein